MTSRPTVYLDYNATAPIRPQAAEAVARALAVGGNPSSVHAAGRAARAVLEAARGQVAALIGASPSAIVFTSGGTEANALAIGSALDAGARRLLVGATEHDSVLQAARASGADVLVWPVSAEGVADLEWLEQRIAGWTRADGPLFAALMLANNETGVIQPVKQAAALLRAAGGRLHVDAVQAAGKVAIDFSDMGAATLSLSAHKLGGPQGSGALVAAPNAGLSRQLHGGGQERSRRAGTENLSGAAGFGAACAAALADLGSVAMQAAWRDEAAERLAKAAPIVVMGQGAERLPTVLSFAVAGFGSELQVVQMDLAGVMVSAGAACSSGKVGPSAVLTAMGQGKLAGSALRVSGGWASTEADWDRFVTAWLAAWDQFTARRRHQPAA